jgi:hypothetical protein
MDQRDLEAMRRAIATLRGDAELGATVEALLQDQGEQAAGIFAVGLLQVKNLKLKAWECPPCDSSETASNHYGARPNEVALLRKLLTLGLSRYEPDPLRAIERVERERVA